MHVFANTWNSIGVLFGRLPLKEMRPSALFVDMKYTEGSVLFGSARQPLWFGAIDDSLRDVKGHPQPIRQAADGKRLFIPHKEGGITIEAIFLQLDGKEYLAVCKRHGQECNFRIGELRRLYSEYVEDSEDRQSFRRPFPGIPQSDR